MKRISSIDGSLINRRVLIRVTPDIHEKMLEKSKSRNISMNLWINRALVAAIKKEIESE